MTSMPATDAGEDAAIAAAVSEINVAHDDELEALKEPELDDDGREVPPPALPEFMDRQSFRNHFIALHSAPAFVDPDFAAFSLPTDKSGDFYQDARLQGAWNIADKLYDRCALDDAPKWMKALIAADNSGFEFWGAIAAYTFGMSAAYGQYKAAKLAPTINPETEEKTDA